MSEPTMNMHRSRTEVAQAGRHRERRRASRTPVKYVRCFSPSPGIIFNVSAMGVGIETFRSFERGDNVFLTSELAGRPQRTFGKIRWCRQIATAGGSGTPVYQVGIALAEPLEKEWLSALRNGVAAGSTTVQGGQPCVSKAASTRREY